MENGQSYVYIEGKNKKLKKQYVRTGQTLYSTYIEVKEGVSETDWIAFPYGKAVKEGAPVKELEGSGLQISYTDRACVFQYLPCS